MKLSVVSVTKDLVVIKTDKCEVKLSRIKIRSGDIINILDSSSSYIPVDVKTAVKRRAKEEFVRFDAENSESFTHPAPEKRIPISDSGRNVTVPPVPATV